MYYEYNNELVIVDRILFNEVLWCNGFGIVVVSMYIYYELELVH